MSIKRLVLLLLIGLVAMLIQATLLKPLLPASLVPNLAVCLVVFLAFYEVTPLGALFAFLLGLELDFFSGLLLGPWAGSFTVVFVLFSLLSQRIFVESNLAAAVVVVASTFLVNIVYAVLIFELRPFVGGFFWHSLQESIVSGLCAPLVLYILRRLCLKRDRGSGGRSLNFAFLVG